MSSFNCVIHDLVDMFNQSQTSDPITEEDWVKCPDITTSSLHSCSWWSDEEYEHEGSIINLLLLDQEQTDQRRHGDPRGLIGLHIVYKSFTFSKFYNLANDNYHDFQIL